MQSRHLIYLKFAYLLAASTVLVVTHQAWIYGVVASVQALLFALRPVPTHQLKKTVTRLGLLIVTVFLSHLFFAPSDGATVQWTVPGLGWTLMVAPSGLRDAGMLSARVLMIVLISVWVQRSSGRDEFVAALGGLRLPQTVALSLDATLALVAGDADGAGRRGRGQGGGRGSGSGGRGDESVAPAVTWQQLRQRKAGVVIDLVDRALANTAAYLQRAYPHLTLQQVQRIALVAGGCVGIMSLRLLQFLPGLPIAPGHKNIAVVPLMLFVAKRHGGLGGTMLGLTLGLVSFMLGFGKFGIFEALHFIVPGILADLLAPWLRNRRGAWQFTQLVVFGAILGAGRFAANAALIVLAGTPVVALVAYAPMLVSQIAFGAAGALLGTVLMSTSFGDQPPQSPKPPHPENP